MSNIWFTSDLHFGHKNIIKYEGRPFSSVEEMDEVIIKNFNEVVKDGDLIYNIGDFALGKYNTIENLKTLKDRLNGYWFCVPGDHEPKEFNKVFSVLQQIQIIKHDNLKIILCHYPLVFWPQSHYGTWMLHGHHHADSKKWVEQYTRGRIYNVCVGAHNYFPYNLDEIKEIMKNKEDNLNLLQKLKEK